MFALQLIMADWQGGGPACCSRTVPSAPCGVGKDPVSENPLDPPENVCSRVIATFPSSLESRNVHVSPGMFVTWNVVTAEPSVDTVKSTSPPLACVPVYVAPGTWFAEAAGTNAHNARAIVA